MKQIILLAAFILLGVIIALLNKYTRPKVQSNPDPSTGSGSAVGSDSSASSGTALRLRSETETGSGPSTSSESEIESVSSDASDEAYERPDGCCGAHEVCENESLLASNTKIIYFADEELDDFKDRDPETYSEEEIGQFEEVFFTLRENELVDWLKSLQLRHVPLPPSIKEQALMIISERRKEPAID